MGWGWNERTRRNIQFMTLHVHMISRKRIHKAYDVEFSYLFVYSHDIEGTEQSLMDQYTEMDSQIIVMYFLQPAVVLVNILIVNKTQTQASNMYFVLLYDMYVSTNVYIFLHSHKDSKLLQLCLIEVVSPNVDRLGCRSR